MTKWNEARVVERTKRTVNGSVKHYALIEVECDEDADCCAEVRALTAIVERANDEREKRLTKPKRRLKVSAK